MAVGGLTPAISTVRAIRDAVLVPLRIMVRPHARSFVYEGADIEHIHGATEAFSTMPVSHIVFGALTADGQVDVPLMRQVAAAANPIAVSMHRAIDHTADPDRAFSALATIVGRVLCSGQSESAWEGRDRLRDWVQRFGAQFNFAVGGGVTQENIAALARHSGAPEMHVGSAARTGGAIDPAKIQALRAALA
jgi:copper homeostasis protein